MAKVTDFKKKVVNNIIQLSKEYPIIGVVNMENLPAPQLQAMRAELRDKVSLFMTKKTLIAIALDKIKGEKKGIENFTKYFYGMPALIFTKDSPFKLTKTLKKSKTAAPAKAGQTAPKDIVIPAGPTPFAPGPIISELGSIGLKVGVEGGKVAVKEDGVVTKKGEKIDSKVADVLVRLDIKPMEVGLDLVVAYEDGVLYEKDILDVDDQQYLDNVNLAASQAFNLAFEITYITKDNINPLIAKAFNDSKAIGLEQNIIDEGIIGELLGKAERSMLSLKGAANIEAVEQPKEEVKEEKKEEDSKAEEAKPVEEKSKPTEEKKETPKEVPKPEVKEEPKPKEESKVEEPKPVEKQDTPKEQPKEEVKEEKKEETLKEEPKEEEPKPEPKPEHVKEEKKEEKPAEPKPVEEKKEVPKEQPKKEEPKPAEEPKPKVPKPESKEEKMDKEIKKEKDKKEIEEVENLTKELIKKGTLRK